MINRRVERQPVLIAHAQQQYDRGAVADLVRRLWAGTPDTVAVQIHGRKRLTLVYKPCHVPSIGDWWSPLGPPPEV